MRPAAESPRAGHPQAGPGRVEAPRRLARRTVAERRVHRHRRRRVAPGPPVTAASAPRPTARGAPMDGLTRHYRDKDDRSGAGPTTASTTRDRPPRLLLTVEEAADRIGICRSNMFKLIRQGDV